MAVQPHIYLDHSATTPVDPAVVEAMLPYWTEFFGNPSSVHHFGRNARRALDQSRQTIADVIQADPAEIIFTGSGSESDNLALRGVMLAAQRRGAGNHLIINAIEHKAVLDTARQLRDQFGVEVTVLPVDHYGQVSVEAAAGGGLPKQTGLTSPMGANNGSGSWGSKDGRGELARARGILFHTDAVQAVAYTAWDMRRQPIDLLSMAPHKFYGPKGVGILYVRNGIELLPPITGGSQEGGRRPGTENVAFAVGAAHALALAQARRAADTPRLAQLRDTLIAAVLSANPAACQLTGHPTQRLPHHASFAVRGASANDLLMHLDMAGIAVGSGSACLVGNPQPSATLEALGLTQEWTRGGLRFSFGRNNTLNDAHTAAHALNTAFARLRHLTPALA